MLSYKILYVSESRLRSKAANSIQVMSMCAAFVENGFEVDLLCRNSSKNQIEGVNMIEGPASLVFYRFWLVYKIISGSYKNSYHIIFGRSYVAQLLVTFLGLRSYLEIHTNEKSVFLKKLMFSLAKKKNLIFVPISAPLVVDMGLQNLNYIIAHDGHANKNSFKTPKKEESQKLDVGYFGKLSERKGLEILKFLDQQEDMDFNLHVYSPDSDEYRNFSDKAVVGYIEHKDILKKMESMDVLLLPIKPAQFRDYSKYTSPLKLFEYASVGRTIILSDVASLREIDFPQGVYFCETNVDWISALKTIEELKVHEDISVLGEIKKWSQDYSWTNRVKNILMHGFS